MLYTPKPKILAIIPARGGSKGLPGKNIYPTGPLKQPLIEFTIHAAVNSEYITDTVVCSDSNEILNVVTELNQKTYFTNNVCCLKRPPDLAKDDTPMDDVVMFCLDHYMKKISTKYDFVMLLQPTSPLRTFKDIDAALALYFATDATSLISVSIPYQNPLKSFLKNKSGYLNGIVNNEYPFMNRQQLPVAYVQNGAIYFCHTNYFLAHKTFFSSKTTPFVMPPERSIDVDTLEDIKNVEKYMSNKM